MPTIIGAKTLTSKISMAIIIMAAMTAIMMDPALPHVLITTWIPKRHNGYVFPVKNKLFPVNDNRGAYQSKTSKIFVDQDIPEQDFYSPFMQDILPGNNEKTCIIQFVKLTFHEAKSYKLWYTLFLKSF